MATLKQISRSLWEQIFPYEIRVGMEEVPYNSSPSHGQPAQSRSALSKAIPTLSEADKEAVLRSARQNQA